MKKLCFILVIIGIMHVLTSCQKDLAFEGVHPKVSASPLNIQPTRATFSWTVEYPGKIASVVEVSLNEDMSDATRYGSDVVSENKSFTIEADNLHEETNYYYRYIVWNSYSNFEMEVRHFTTTKKQAPVVLTEAASDITENTAIFNGVILSDGGSQVLECGFYYGTSPNPESSGRKVMSELVQESNFSYPFTSTDGNTVYYVSAYATNDLGTNYGDEIIVTLHPVGAINGLFSVSAEKQVYFSQGNLQYRASDGSWRFAERQYECIGEANSNISETYIGWIDLFGWGTSGFRDPSDPYNTNYHPFSTSISIVNTNYNYCGYGPSTNMGNPNLTDSQYDWGLHNRIANGGELDWWTLSKDEWEYVLDKREASNVNGTANARYAKATVAEVRGIILFPDQYTHPLGIEQPFGINDQSSFFESNRYTVDDWAQIESCGAVFLPAAGSRNGNTIGNVGINGSYWSATNNGSHYAYCVSFHQQYLYPAYNYGTREYGISVRLVRVP